MSDQKEAYELLAIIEDFQLIDDAMAPSYLSSLQCIPNYIVAMAAEIKKLKGEE